MEVQLADLIYTYPSQDDPAFQTIITAKREFSELASSMNEPVPAPGYLYKHQELIKRFMIPYDRLLLFHRAGTGKTCTIFGSSESVKDGILRATVNFIEDYIKPRRTNIKRIYILTRGDALINELKRQLVCVCTNGTYLTPQVVDSTTEQQQKANVRRAISPYYEIMGYTSFSNEIERSGYNDRQLKELFSDTMFIVDEIQNIRADHSTNTEEEARKNYDILHRLFHIIERSKIILASATPMVNDASEIRDVMNLLLPLDRQIRGGNFSNPSLEDFEPYFRGMISYVRELDTGITPMYIGTPMDAEYKIGEDNVRSQFIIYPSEMGEIQEEAYREAIQGENGDRFYINSRMASNFVFPDGTYDKKAFDRWVIRLEPDVYEPRDELRTQIKRNLASLSRKLDNLIRIATQEPGSTFIYCDFMYAGGAAIIGMVLRTLGIEQYRETASPFTTSDKGLKPFCSTGAGATRTIRLDKRLRFALFTSDTSPAKSSNILDLFNSYENRHGEYLKILIGSPVSKIGLNLANVVQVHLFGPAWNQSHIYQAISRAIRSTSHVALLAEARERELDPASARVDVRIYQHASIIPEETTTDLLVYQLAEKKDISIRRMERIMKRVAFDCQIHYNRNVRATDIDYSAACDYDVCAYPCSSPAPTEELKLEVLPSYNTLYSNSTIEEISSSLKVLLLDNPMVKLDQLYRLFPHRAPTDILLAVEDLVTDKATIVDRYGFEGFIRLEGDTIYVQRDYPLGASSKSVVYYVNNLIATQVEDITQYAITLEAPKQDEIIEALQQLDPESPLFETYVKSLNLPSKIILLEKAYIEHVHSGRPIAWAEKILRIFDNYIYYFYEPTESIARVAELLTIRATGRGRKPKGGKRRINPNTLNLEAPDPNAESGGEIIYLHTLYSQSYDKTSYDTVSKFIHAEGKIRLYKPSEEIGFRDANDAETPVYSQMIQRVLADKLSDYEQYNIYGIVLGDGAFRIRDKSTEDAIKAGKDARKINRGRICKSWRKPDLVDVLYQLNIEPPTVTDSGMDDSQALQFLQSKKVKETGRINLREFSSEKLQFFARWYLENMSVAEICDLLQKTLADTGRLFSA
jgi:hypothetical protein